MLPKDIPGGSTEPTGDPIDIMEILGKASDMQEQRHRDYRSLLLALIFLVIAVVWHIDLMTTSLEDAERQPVGMIATGLICGIFYYQSIKNAKKFGQKP